MLVPRTKFHLESIPKTKLKSAKKTEKAKAKKFTDNKIMYTTKCFKVVTPKCDLDYTFSRSLYTCKSMARQSSLCPQLVVWYIHV